MIILLTFYMSCDKYMTKNKNLDEIRETLIAINIALEHRLVESEYDFGFNSDSNILSDH